MANGSPGSSYVRSEITCTSTTVCGPLVGEWQTVSEPVAIIRVPGR